MKNPQKLLLMGMLVFLSCTIKKPVTPSWDVHFEVPLIEKKYTVEELFEDADNVVMDHTQEQVILDIEKSKTIRVGKFLTAKPVSDQNQITALIPGVIQTIQDTLEFEDSFLIETAEFDTGYVKVEITTASNIEAQIAIPSLFLNDMPFTRIVKVSGGKKEEIWDLTGFTFRPEKSLNKNYVPYTVELTASGYSSVDLRIDLSNLRYRRITGWLNQTEVTIEDTIETGIKVSDEFKGIQFGSVFLDFTIYNAIKFPADLDVNITGIGKNGETASLHVTESIPSSNFKKTATYEARDIINLLPETLILTGKAKLGDGRTYATISKEDSIRVTSHVQAPFIFSLPAKESKTEVDTIEMGKGAREFIRDNLNSASLVFEVENHLPIGASVNFYFSNTRGDSTIYLNPELLKTIGLRPALLTTNLGTVMSPGIVKDSVLDMISFSLSKKEVQVFDAPEVYMGVQFNFPGTQGMVKIRPGDWIKVRCRIEADILADFEKEKGGGS